VVLNRSELLILGIDDSRDDREIIRRILEHRGYSFIQAANIQSSKDLMSDRIPHLILLDIEIGEENGFDLLDFIKNEDSYKDIPVVVVSNHASSALVAEALSRGAADYIIKPVNSNVLNERLEKQLSPLMKTRGQSYSIDQESEESRSILRFHVNVSKISEFGAYVVSNTYFRWPQPATLTSDLLKEIDMDTMPKRIIKTTVLDDHVKRRFPTLKYETYLTYVGTNEEDSRNIRRYIMSNLTSGGKKGGKE
jgi:CheY-like chemotaxis protein